MKRKSLLALGLAVMLAVPGCGSKDSGDDTVADVEESSESSETPADEDMFTKRDLNTDYDESTSVLIQLNGGSAECSSDAVQIDGSTVTITDEGTYIFSGTLDDGMIIVNAKDSDKPQLVFDGVTINSETSAPLYVLEADKVIITLAEGSTNTLSNGGTFTAIDENNIDAVIFSKQDLSLNGSGSLIVESPAGHGIVSKDDLVLTSGTYTVNSASHGLDANDSVRIVNSALNIASGKDGIHAENADDTELGFVYVESGSFEISAEGDGMSAGAYMQIEDGSFNIVSGGGNENAQQQTSDFWGGFGGRQMGQGMNPQDMNAQSPSDTEDESSTSIKAIKATGNLTINGGTFTIDSADDAIHSNMSAIINGGTYEIASGDDGFHADEALTITEGTINITESYEGLEGLNIEISGGDIKIVSSDDGINAAGGMDSSGYGGQRGNDQFGGPGRGGMNGEGGSSSNGSIAISGGTIYMNASGDGVDANGSLEISGGHITVCGPTQGDTAVLDYDTSAVITGGTFIGTGSTMMAQTFSDSKQGVIAVSVGNQTAGTQITLEDAKGNIVMEDVPELDFGIVILSSPDIVKGEVYKITVGTVSGEFEAN